MQFHCSRRVTLHRPARVLFSSDGSARRFLGAALPGDLGAPSLPSRRPYSYGTWDAVPGRPETRPTHARWLKQYLPLVEEGTWAWLEIHQSTLFARPLPSRSWHPCLPIATCTWCWPTTAKEAVELATTDRYVASGSAGAAGAERWTLPKRSLVILRQT